MNKAFYSGLIAMTMLLSSIAPALAVEEPASEPIVMQDLIEDVDVIEPKEADDEAEPTELPEIAESEDDEEPEEKPAEEQVCEETAEPTEEPLETIQPIISMEPIMTDGPKFDDDATLAAVETILPLTRPFTTPEADGYFKFVEDFGSYTSFKPFTPSNQFLFHLNDFAVGNSLADRSDNVKWKLTAKGVVSGGAQPGGGIDEANDRIYVRGAASTLTRVAMDMTGALEDAGIASITELPRDIQKFNFTVANGSRSAGTMLFISNNSKNFVWCGVKGSDTSDFLSNSGDGRQFVVIVKDDVAVYEEYGNSVSGAVNWEVKLEDGILSWESWKDGNDRSTAWKSETDVFSQYIDLDNFEHLVGFGGAGEGCSYMNNFEYETADMYTPHIGFYEPSEAVYLASEFDRNSTAHTEVALSSDDVGWSLDKYNTYKLEKPINIQKVEYKNFYGHSFALGYDDESAAGGISWDIFNEDGTVYEGTLDSSTQVQGVNISSWNGSSFAYNALRQWVNTYSSKKNYQYVKTPDYPRKNSPAASAYSTGVLRIYTNVSKNSEVIVPLGGSQELWFVKNSAWANDFDAVSSNTYYVTTDMSNESNGYVTVNGVKESYYKENSGVPIKVTLTGGKDYYVNISVRGDLYDIVHGNTTNFATYIGNQQAALTNLNNLITAGNPANVRRFFTLTTPIITPNINTLDNIDASEFEDSKLDALYPNRIMTYGGSYFNATDMQSLTNLCNLLKREILVGDFNNLNDNTVQKTDAEGNLIYDDQGAPVYYTADELIVDAINTNKTALGLPVDNKYYTTNVAGVEYGLEIRKVLKNTTFANQADLKDRIDDATVMTVLKNVDAADTLIEMFETYQGPTQINLTAADLAKLTEIKANSTVKNQFIQSLNLVKSTYTMPTQIQAFISAYVIPTVTPSPSPTPRPIQGGGGGGGFSSVKTPVNEPKQEDNTVSEKGQVFSDVPIDYWGYEAIRYMYAKKAVSGYPNGTFDPDNTLTKAELIQMIVNLFKIEAEIPEDYVNPFEDVNEDDWFYKSVITANVYGIFSGDGVRTNPNAPINRQEMATIIYRVLEKSGKTLSRENEVIKFSDEDNISDWAYTAIAKMQAAGIISGSNGMFDPRGNSTRAMAAQMLYKAMQGFEVPAETEE